MNAKRKQWLVKPDELPRDWPRNWVFPAEAWPPGYPLPYTGRAWLKATFSNDILSVRVVDEYDEETDELNGHFVHVLAAQSDETGAIKVIRLRQGDNDTWSKQALFKIYGAHVDEWIEFDRDRMQGQELTIFISVYGMTGLEARL
jgi:hypothetical protein